jgi:hypothetical protein
MLHAIEGGTPTAPADDPDPPAARPELACQRLPDLSEPEDDVHRHILISWGGASRSWWAVTQPVCRSSRCAFIGKPPFCAALPAGQMSGHVSVSAVTAMSGRRAKLGSSLFARHFSTARRVL